MAVTSDHARAALQEIDLALAGTRRAMLAHHAADHFIVWGVIWMLAFGAMHATSWHPGWIWLPLATVGSLLSAGIGIRAGRRFVSADAGRIGWAWLCLVLFAAIWAVILHPFNTQHFGAYLATVFMFGYVAGGLWFGRFFVVLGAVVTGLTLAGVLAAPGWLNLIMAIGGGGSMVAAGVYLRAAFR